MPADITSFERHLLESLKDPVCFTDTDHVIRYLNQAAVAHYEQGAALLGTSLFDCHNDESNDMIRDIFSRMQAGECEEQLITDNEKHRIFMKAVRDDAGALIGYYERYEPPTADAAG
jgi:PAS domain-containing protein